MVLFQSTCKHAESELPPAEPRASSPLSDHATTASRKLDELFHAHYGELIAIARRQIGLTNCTILDATALVHEAFLKICVQRNIEFKQRAQFFSYATLVMRHLLIDSAMRHGSLRSGGHDVHVGLDDPAVKRTGRDTHCLFYLDSALTALAANNPRAARVLDLHCFKGYDIHNIAEFLGVARRTVDRELNFARLYIRGGL